MMQDCTGVSISCQILKLSYVETAERGAVSTYDNLLVGQEGNPGANFLAPKVLFVY